MGVCVGGDKCKRCEEEEGERERREEEVQHAQQRAHASRAQLYVSFYLLPTRCLVLK